MKDFIKVITYENEQEKNIYNLHLEIAKKSKTINNILNLNENDLIKNGLDENGIPLLNIDDDSLNDFVFFAKNHLNNDHDECSENDIKHYENLSNKQIIKYIKAALYLDYPLYEIILYKIMFFRLKGKSPIEQASILDIKID